eukprot:TRINITY_DN323_c0_g1_i1.p2 TRINITY_DN323_c0_g1~~TRINITY_DN323_c0_g1_i1.p2  ORF type:complete len:254 (+),score=108.84 TRINITY_DN323_c0_g1_i1:1-762(+)
MIRRPPRSTLMRSSAASDVYKRQVSTQSTGRKGNSGRFMSALRKSVEASARRVLTRVSTETNTPVREGALKAAFGEDSFAAPFEKLTDSFAVDRETRAVYSAIESLGNKGADASGARDWAAYEKFATTLAKTVPEAAGWSQLIKRVAAEEKALESEVDINPKLEAALANALVPLERSFQDIVRQAEVMGASSKARIAELSAELKQVEAEISKLDTLSINDIAKEHPEWEKDANQRIRNHDWNQIPGEKDPEAH